MIRVQIRRYVILLSALFVAFPSFAQSYRQLYEYNTTGGRTQRSRQVLTSGRDGGLETASSSQSFSSGLLYYYPVFFETESPENIASAIKVDDELTKEFEKVLSAIKPKRFYPQKYLKQACYVYVDNNLELHRFYMGYSEVLYNSELKVYGQVIDVSKRKVYETRENELLVSLKLLVERYAEYYEKYNIKDRTREYYKERELDKN